MDEPKLNELAELLNEGELWAKLPNAEKPVELIDAAVGRSAKLFEKH